MSYGGSYNDNGRRGRNPMRGNNYYQDQYQHRSHSNENSDGNGRDRGWNQSQPYNNESRRWEGRRGGGGGRGGGRSRSWRGSERHETHRRGGESDHSAERAEGSGRGRKRPPPGLRGREIGLWHARQSQARKEEQEKKNRPVVHMDADKQRNIERLLDNLKQEDASEGRASSSGATSSPKIKKQSPSEQIRHRDKTPDYSTEFRQPLPVSTHGNRSRVFASSATSSFVYQSSDASDNSPPDCWTEHDDSDVKIEGKDNSPPDCWTEHDNSDVKIEGEGSSTGSTSSLVTFPVEVVPPLEDSSEEEDDRENSCVSGVVQYMKSHDDYPFGEDDDDDALAECDGYMPLTDNPVLDREIRETMESLQDNSDYRKMLQFRQKLPAFEMKQTIVDTINGNQVLVISGETGCGKTTQVPQFILDDYIQRGIGSQCCLICTQPRRISAISVAERVAAERCETVNGKGQSSVGYQIRLEARRPRACGSILFCTTGIVLKMLEGDAQLRRASHVIIDEIHERDLQSDFLMIILRDLLPKRRDLKVILMSATLNAEMFSQYFGKCPMLNIPGYTFPVKEYLLEETLELTNYSTLAEESSSRRRRGRRKTPEDMEMDQNYQVWCRNQRGKYRPRTMEILQNFDYSQIDIDLVNHIITHICHAMGDGAILVFVPGWEEIKKLNEKIQTSPRYKSGALRVIPLHSLMPTVNQREVFERPPPGVRKIVIATNIAETSITIDDIVFVIDCGKIKVKDFNPEMNLTSLEPKWVSKANAKQRRGRAGRVQAGVCFHLYTEFHYQVAQDYLPPEMLRTRLEELCLQIKLLKLGRIVPFISKAMQHPSMEAVSHAVETLMELSALDADENLLPLGYHLARLPMEPHTGKMILFGAMFSCLDPILTVAASLSFKDAFVIPLGKEDLADKARKVLAKGSKSDHIMLINAYSGWEASFQSGSSRRYCWENFLSENTLQLLKDMKRQLAELLYDIGFLSCKNHKDSRANQNSSNHSMIKAVLCAGLYPNVAQVTKPAKARRNHKSVGMAIKDGSRVAAHPKSVNSNESFFESKWMVFYHKLKTSKVYIHDSTMVSPYPLLFFGGRIDILTENKQELVSVDNWVIFKASSSTAKLVKDLRAQLDRVLTQKITKPGPTVWDKSDKEGAIMTAISDLITTEVLGRGQQGDGSVGHQF